jgi:hypothetical protein
LIDQVHIQDEWHRNTKRVIVLGRAYPGAPRGWLRADGEWEQLSEAAPPDEKIGFVMPEGALEAIVEAAGGIAPQPATDRHLQDAIDVRDRLLAIVEKT